MASDLHSLNSTEVVQFALLMRTGPASYSVDFISRETALMQSDASCWMIWTFLELSTGVDGKTGLGCLTEVFLLLMIGSLDGMLFMCCHLRFVADFHQGMFSRDQCTCWNDVCVCAGV